MSRANTVRNDKPLSASAVIAPALLSKQCVYTPHSLRPVTAKVLLLDGSVDIRKVQDLLGSPSHYNCTDLDKRRRSIRKGASYDVPI